MSKKILSLLTAVMLACSAFTACGSSQGDNGTAETTTTAATVEKTEDTTTTTTTAAETTTTTAEESKPDTDSTSEQ